MRDRRENVTGLWRLLPESQISPSHFRSRPGLSGRALAAGPAPGWRRGRSLQDLARSCSIVFPQPPATEKTPKLQPRLHAGYPVTIVLVVLVLFLEIQKAEHEDENDRNGEFLFSRG